MATVVTETKTTKKVQYKGLCSTCVNAASCTFPRNSERPVMHCDEFEGFETSRVVTPKKFEQETSTQEASVVEYKGLCRNCENRVTCTYPKPAGGVWRCEEYC